MFGEKNYMEAGAKYQDALDRLEQLMLRVKAGEPEWEDLLEMKIQLLLNFAQCKLSLDEYYPVIEL